MKIFWFSGTGNSLWAAKKLAYGLKAELCPIMACREGEVRVEDDAVGFVFPTYVGDIPWPAKEFLLRFSAPKDAYIFAVMTSGGGDSGVSFLCIDRALHTRGLTLSLARELRLPGNCLPGAVKLQEPVLKEAPDALLDILGDVLRRTANFTSEGKSAGKHFVRQTPFYSPRSLMKRFTVKSVCTGCGTCAAVCPMGNITITDGKPVHGLACANCFACVHWCPKHATRVCVPVIRRRPLYHHPAIRLKDMTIQRWSEQP